MNIHLPCTLALLVFAASATAQNQTAFPTENQSTPGGTYETQFPLGLGISRTQTVLGRDALAIPNGRQISSIRFRQAPGLSSTSRMLQLAVYMGGTTRTFATATGDFLANYESGTPRTLVYGPAVYTLPALTATGSPYGSAAIQLTTPYTYNANENLVVEFVITANNNANQAFAYYIEAPYYLSPTSNFGAGCLTSANQIPALNGTGGYYGGSVAFALTQAPANSTLYFHMNLVPSTPIAGDPFGAPGCSLLVNPLAAVLASAPSGSFYYNVPIPNSSAFYGISIYGQAIIFDLFANAMGFAASNGTRIDIGRLPPMAKISASGNAAATTGSIQRQVGPIFIFDHN
jgi:hypothetical protein